MPKEEIKDLEGLEGVYDVLMSEDFFEEMDADTLLLNSLESRYEAGAPLGEGGVKSISSSYDLVCQRKVARAILKDKKNLSGRFINEARILSRLEHSNIVPLYDLGLDENKEVYFTMRLLGGENLRGKINLLRDQKSNWAESRSYFLEVFLKVCDALSYAHSKGIVHLDLKPSNIQIEDFGEVLVYDWGLACDLANKDVTHSVSTTEANEKHYTIDGQIKGTPGYMAPEQADPSLGQCNEQTDVYSLGALLYTLLTYKVPIEDLDLEETLSKTVSGDFCEPRLARPEARIPSSLNAVVMKAMALKASDRYQSVEELSSEIRAYLSGFATHAEQASFLTLARLMLKRYRRIFITLLLALMLILVLSGLFLERLQEEKTAVEHNLLRSQKAEKEVSGLRDEAVILVDALKQEKAEGRQMRRKLMPKLTWMVYTHQNQDRFEQATMLAKSLYQLDPTNQEVIRAYAYTLFGEYNFSEVLGVLSAYKGHENVDFLKGFAKRAAEIQGVSDFVKVVKDLQFSPAHLRKNLDQRLLYSMSEHFSPHEQIEIARHFMAKRGGKFEVIEQKALYELSLKDNKSFEGLIYLRGLPIESLNLSNTMADDLITLSGMPLRNLVLTGSRVLNLRGVNLPNLEYLDIHNTQINDLLFLRNSKIQNLRLNDVWCDLSVLSTCKNLQEVILPKGLYSPAHLKSLQPKVKVILE